MVDNEYLLSSAAFSAEKALEQINQPAVFLVPFWLC